MIYLGLKMHEILFYMPRNKRFPEFLTDIRGHSQNFSKAFDEILPKTNSGFFRNEISIKSYFSA